MYEHSARFQRWLQQRQRERTRNAVVTKRLPILLSAQTWLRIPETLRTGCGTTSKWLRAIAFERSVDASESNISSHPLRRPTVLPLIPAGSLALSKWTSPFRRLLPVMPREQVACQPQPPRTGRRHRSAARHRTPLATDPFVHQD